MKLITKEIEKKLDKAGYYGDTAIFKLFNPVGAATWVITGRDPECHDILYGVADLGMGFVEAGTISLSELESVRLPFGMKIERDRSFKGGKNIEYYLSLDTLAGC
jgi:hypothetical protein